MVAEIWRKVWDCESILKCRVVLLTMSACLWSRRGNRYRFCPLFFFNLQCMNQMEKLFRSHHAT